jgi:hypothetical protein
MRGERKSNQQRNHEPAVMKADFDAANLPNLDVGPHN